MKHNQDMLEKHKEDWADKVRIVGISLDDKKDEVVKRVNEKSWQAVDHFFLGGWNAEHPAMKSYQFDGIPYGVLIDGKGKIVHSGHPSHIDLEKTIDGFVKGANEEAKKQEKTDFKAFSKVLESKVLEALNSEKLKSNNYKLTITWSKESKFNGNGEVVDFSFKKPKLVLSYHIKFEKEVKQVEEALYNLLDKSLFDVKLDVDDPKGAYKFCVETLRSEIVGNSLEEAQIEFQKSHSFTWNGSSFECENQKAFVHKNAVKPSKSAQVIAFQNNIQKALPTQGNKGLLLKRFQLSCKLSKGDQFVAIDVEEALKEDSERFLFKHEEGEVLLVDFWATWCGPCQGPMAHNQVMLEKNAEKWGNKVRIVGVSVDQSKEDLKQRIQEKNWTKVVHYFFGENKEGMKVYGVRGIPEVLLVDQKGVIVYKGHPAHTNLEQNINDLLEGKSLDAPKEEEAKEVLQPFTKEDHKKLTSLLKDPKFNDELKAALKEGLKYNPKLNIELSKVIVFDSGVNVQEEKITNPELSFGIRKSDLSKLNPILSRIYEVVPANKIKEKKNIIETFDIPWGTECNACKKELKPFDQQYYCAACKIHFCVECGDKDDNTKVGNERLVHPHNMIWINISNEEGLKDIDEYKIGKNLAYTENCQSFAASCNGCGGGVGGGYRFICISCRPGPTRPGGFVDICHNCMATLRIKEENEENKEKKTKVLAGLEEESHDEKSHLWLRICFGNNYYQY